MAVSTAPIYSKVGDIQWITAMTAANTTLDITTGTSYLAFTADATNGGFVREVRLKASPANNTAASLLRVWLNNGSATGTIANSALIAEIGLPATTASNVNPQPDFVCPINMAIPPGYRIYLTLGVAPGGSGQFTGIAIGGKY
jgi:hypothetical protein